MRSPALRPASNPVAPGLRQVTVTPLSLISLPSAAVYGDLSFEAYPIVTRMTGASKAKAARP